MSKLLVQTVFDNFLLSELDVVTFNAFHINGKINRSWYDTDELDTEEEYILEDLETLIKELHSNIPQLLYISVDENKERLLTRAGGEWKEKDISQFCLNMKYENGKMYLTTGVAYTIFTMNHTLQEQWDYDLKKYLKYYEIEYEEVS